MTRGKKLGILALVLVVLMGATLVAGKLSTGETVIEEETSVTIFAIDADAVTALGWTYDGESIRLTRDEETVWAYDADEAFPLDQSYPDAMLALVKEIQAVKIIEDYDSLADYGLEEPLCSITLEAEETWTIALGEESSLGGERYLSIGDGNVYLVEDSILASFTLGLYDIIACESIPSMTSVSTVEIASGSETLTLAYLEESGLAYSDLFTWFWQQGSTYTALDTDLTKTLVSSVTGLSWSSCVDYQADEEALGSYGLSQPAVTVTITYTQSAQVATNETDDDGNAVYETQETEETFVLELGDYTGSFCYARLAGSSMVYLIDGSVCDTLLLTTGEDLLPQSVISLDWSIVTGLDVTVDGITYAMDKVVEEETDENGATTSQSYVYYLGDVAVEITDALDDLQALEGIGSATASASGQAVLAITFYQESENYPEVTLAFYSYDSSSYLVSLNGETRLLADKTELQAIADALQAALEQ